MINSDSKVHGAYPSALATFQEMGVAEFGYRRGTVASYAVLLLFLGSPAVFGLYLLANNNMPLGLFLLVFGFFLRRSLYLLCALTRRFAIELSPTGMKYQGKYYSWNACVGSHLVFSSQGASPMFVVWLSSGKRLRIPVGLIENHEEMIRCIQLKVPEDRTRWRN